MLGGASDLSPMAGSKALLQRVLEKAAKESGADRASIMLVGEERREPILARGIGLPELGASPVRSHGLAARVVNTGRPLAVCNDNMPRDQREWGSLLGTPQCSVVLPLFAEKRVVGVLSLAKTTPGKHISPDQASRAAGIAAIAGPGIEAAIAAELLSAELQRARTAADEANHRLVNNLSDVLGILYLQSSMRLNPAYEGVDWLEETKDAVQAMLVTNRLLREQRYGEVDASELAEETVRSFQRERITDRRDIGLDFDAGNLMLPGRSARALAMVLLELLCNSVKHGFAPGEAGSIGVNLSATGGMAKLIVSNPARRGEGDPEQHGSGLGLRIIEMLVKRDLRGELSIEDNAAGRRVTVSFPAPVPRVDVQ
ncbi:MAG: GAF domain-containing protein [Chloroflexi bacterium]|nr:GAF domain-containing protein [Chloroflexota bacterium]